MWIRALLEEEGYPAVEFVLVRVQSDGGKKPAVIKRERTLIGRHTGCHLRIRSGEVSRQHCEILIEEGVGVVRDLDSRNGTYVNGVKVVEKRLEAGDLLAVGPLVFLVQLDGQPESFDAREMFEAAQPGGGSSGEQAVPKKTADSMPTSSGLMDGLDDMPTSSEDSSVVEFEFDFDDEEEEQRSQPPL